MKSYKELTVWQKSYDLSLSIYKATENFPIHEQYGLTSQLRRASVSIPPNIAEGSKRSTKKDYRSFLVNAFGSGAEIETQLLLTRDLNYLTEKNYSDLYNDLTEIMKMLNVMINKLS